MTPTIDLDGYFERIGNTGGRAATLETLRAIHARHPEAIAFENLNAAFEKRGGNLFFGLRYPLRTLLMKDERYWQVLEKMGLRKYYESERTL